MEVYGRQGKAMETVYGSLRQSIGSPVQANSDYLSIVSLGQGYGNLGESLGSQELSKAADGKCTLL